MRAYLLSMAATLCAIHPDCALSAEKPDAFETHVKPFLMKYCIKCHGVKQQKGERRFDQLVATIDNDDALVDQQDILDLLNLGEMPPAKAPQPTNTERRQVVAWLTGNIERYYRENSTTSGRSVLRRLNAREYRNTVRDLLHLDMTMFDPTVTFPNDQTVEHLDNVGQSLVTSGYLLQRYLAAAELVVNKALFPLERPEVQTWKFEDGLRQQPEIDQVFRKVGEFNYMTLFDVIGADKPEGAYGPIHAFSQGVPYDGRYEIRLLATALHRDHPYDDAFIGTWRDEPFRLGIRPGRKDVGKLHLTQPIEPLLAEIELADEQKWYTVEVPLDAGFTPRFTFRNGLMDVRGLYGRLVRKYPDQFPKRVRGGIVEDRFNAIKFGKLPRIQIETIEIKGPLFDEWPTASQRELLGDDCNSILAAGTMTDQQIRSQLTRFASRAYRRRATPDEVDRLVQVVAIRRKAGRSSIEAFSDGIKAALCSPAFLYLEPAGNNDQQLPPESLAARLSYFVWASMPDVELQEAATSGDLTQPTVLKQQLHRMLTDKRSDALLNGFLDSWLTLRDLGSTPPDRSAFGRYYRHDLGTAMRLETHLFARHLMDENLSVDNFLDSDFTFVNRSLAQHYGLKDSPTGSEFERVALTDGRRGGLLGQASVLTVTANGIDTSPVVRGVWLLENILGTPPAAPPPDVEPLDPDIRGAKTIRDQLQKHRDVAACYDCHRKIDPMGFALENFDPIGGWRNSYGRSTKIDASGELPDGQSFRSIEEFKRVLLKKKDQFTRALTTRLLAYAIGRPTDLSDRPQIDAIVTELNNRGGGFRDLIELVVLSETFRKP